MTGTVSWRLAVATTLILSACTAAASSQEASIRAAWTAYLESKSGAFAANAGTPSTRWLSAEQRRWPMYDLAGFYVPNGALPHVDRIRPVGDAYEIITSFRMPGPTPDSTLLTITVYAVRDSGQWKLANALPRRTAPWYRETVGQITYFVQPGLAFNVGRARRAVAFIDSLASAFALPRPAPMDYYVTASVDDALRIIGVELPIVYGPRGAFSKPVNRQVFNGMPSLGEEHRHELTHVVLSPLGATLLASEGIATWLGGTEGRDFKSSTRELAHYLASHPAITLDSIMVSPTTSQAVRYSAGAVLCAMVSSAGGVPALKDFLMAGPGPAELRGTLTRLLNAPWPTVITAWRAAVDRIAAG